MVFLSGFCLFLWEGAFFLVFVFPFPIKSRIFVKFLRHAVSGVSYSFCDEKLHNNIYYLIKSRKSIRQLKAENISKEDFEYMIKNEYEKDRVKEFKNDLLIFE